LYRLQITRREQVKCVGSSFERVGGDFLDRTEIPPVCAFKEGDRILHLEEIAHRRCLAGCDVEKTPLTQRHDRRPKDIRAPYAPDEMSAVHFLGLQGHRATSQQSPASDPTLTRLASKDWLILAQVPQGKLCSAGPKV